MGRAAEWVFETTEDAIDTIFDWNEAAHEKMCDEIGADCYESADSIAYYIMCENLLFEGENDKLPMLEATIKAMRTLLEAAWEDVEFAQKETGYEPNCSSLELELSFEKLAEFLRVML